MPRTSTAPKPTTTKITLPLASETANFAKFAAPFDKGGMNVTAYVPLAQYEAADKPQTVTITVQVG